MKVAYSLKDVSDWKVKASAVTLGVFDGVHLGHRRIIDELVRVREREQRDSAYLLTFDPHPVTVTHSRETPKILTTIDERLELLESMSLDGVFVIKFDEETAALDYRTFIDRYLLGALDMKHLVLGYDCHFGHKREGSPQRVASESHDLGFEVTVVDPIGVDEHVVSSTEIRESLLAGNLSFANELLGHPYMLAGTVVSGRGMGRDLGFPTANVAIADSGKLWPPRGVYAVGVRWRGIELKGMMNVGTAPTVKGKDLQIEVHIFDFDHTLYGDRISVDCHAFLREEQAFRSLDALIDQLTRDRVAAMAALRQVQ
jgi:riboflavin kinase/FMN adenylyltransferase